MARVLSTEQLDPYNGGTFKEMRINRLAMTGHCPLVSAAHNDPRFDPPPSTRRIIEPLPTVRMTEAELDEVLWGTL